MFYFSYEFDGTLSSNVSFHQTFSFKLINQCPPKLSDVSNNQFLFISSLEIILANNNDTNKTSEIRE